MAPIGKYYLGVTPEGPLSATSFNRGGGSANSNGMSASSPNRSSVQQVAQHARQPSQPPPQSPPIHTGDVDPIPAPVSNPSSPPLRNSSFLNQVPGTTRRDAGIVARMEPPRPRFRRTKKTKRTRPRLERERVQRAVSAQARCGKTSSSRLRLRGTADCQISSCLRKTRMRYLGHLSRHVRLRQPRLRHRR
jgi:hypothetical protein